MKYSRIPTYCMLISQIWKIIKNIIAVVSTDRKDVRYRLHKKVKLKPTEYKLKEYVAPERRVETYRVYS